MIRLEYKPNGAWRLIARIEETSKSGAAALILQSLADLTGVSCRVTLERAGESAKVLCYCAPRSAGTPA